MCPACLVTISMIVAGVVSTGGVTALGAKAWQRRKDSKEASGLDAAGDEKEFPSLEKKENEA
jgi:hypothetical protein